MPEYHSLLRRQMRRHGITAAGLSPDLEHFVGAVDAAYNEFDEDRRMLERSLDLSSQELIQANSEMRDANDAKSRFLSTMSHELRTPLTAVIGYAELLEEESQSNGHPEYLADLERIRFAGRHLLGLISEILDFTRIESGKLTISMERCNAASVVEEVASTMEPLMRRNRNTFQIHCSDKGLCVNADPMRLQQILLNLLGNACKFTECATVAIRVYKASRGGTEWIFFQVEDQGIGMSPEQLTKLFQPFCQVSPEIHRRYGGTGLGLVISQKLAELMGGTISVESTLGKGSVFTLSLPCRAIDSPR